MQDTAIKKRKWYLLLGGLGFLIVILAISLFFVIRSNSESATINIMVAPTTAKVLIDGKEYGNSGEYKIRPGEYSAEVSADGFVTKTMNFVAKEGEVARVWVYLDAENGDNAWMEGSSNGLVVGAIRSASENEKMAKLLEQNTIIQNMPIKIDYFTPDYSARVRYVISYKIDDDMESLYLTITDYTGGNYERALDELRNRGYDPTQYEIQYIDKTESMKNGRAM